MDIVITEPTTFKRALNAPNFDNPDEHAVYMSAGRVVRWPMVGGVPMTELPPWFTCESVVHFGVEPAPPKRVEISFGDIDEVGAISDKQKVWAFLLQWVGDNPSGTGAEFKIAYQSSAEMQATIYYSGSILVRLRDKAIERIPEVTDTATFLTWIRDNLDAEDIGGVV